MPNWCDNIVLIRAPLEVLTAIKAAAELGELLQYMRPMPKEYLETDSWYDWRVENWGTKWDLSDVSIDGWDFESDDPSLNLSFNSAWAPPVEALSHFAEVTKDFYFDLYYFESGMMFCGMANNDEHESFVIPMTVAEVAEQIPSDLDDMFNITYMIEEMVQEMEQDNVKTP